MDTSHNHLREPDPCESSFLRAKRYLSDLSQPEKEVLLSNLGVGSGRVLVENLPDEEDLTQKMQGGHNVLKFKDKIFNPEMFSGMGKVFLRKNMAKDINRCHKPINILTLNMFEDKHGLPLVNTIFIVQYDYDLDKGFITIPENSILVFAGGSFRNGTVMLRNTLILPAGLDIEHFMSVNIKGTYKEGSLVYLRKHLRLFNGENWINIGGAPDFVPQDKFELISLLKRYVNAALDIVSPFKITIIPEKNYIESGPHDIKVSWDYNRLISNQDIRLESGSRYKIYEELDKHVREYTFQGIDAEDPVTIVISTTYKGETVSEAITLTFDQNPGLVIDDELDENSLNPVTNRAITTVINNILNTLETFITEEEADEKYATKEELNSALNDIANDLENLDNSIDDINESIDDINESLNNVDGNIDGITDSINDINSALDRKVDKEQGKGLSSNDFTDSLKNKLEGLNPSDYASASHTHTISDVSGLAEALARAGVSYTLDKDNSSIILRGSDGSTSSVTIDGIDETALARIIESKLRLSHGTGTISLKYDNTDLGTVNDERGSDQSGMSQAEVEALIKSNLDITHVGENTLKLRFGNEVIGTGTPDNKGEGDPGGDGLPGTILTFYIQTSSANIPSTPADGQISNLNSGSGEWQRYAPNHVEGGFIWMSQIYETASGGVYGNWGIPILIDDDSEGSAGSDTTDREYIYAVSNVEDFDNTLIGDPSDLPAVQSDNFIPYIEQGDWVDNPQGVSQEARFEFISVRTKTDGVWGKFTSPALWSSYGLNGMNGDGIEYIFYVGQTAPVDDPSEWYTDEQSKADVNKQSYNSDEYIPSGSEWTDDPRSLEPGESVWMSKRKYRNDVNQQSSEVEDAYWHQYSSPVLWSHYGKDAIAAGALDFDNEMMGMPIDINGDNQAFRESSNAYIYYQAGAVTIDSLVCNGLWNDDTQIWTTSEAANYVTIDSNNSKVTVDIPAGGLQNIEGKTYQLKFTATSSQISGNRNGVIKLVGLNTGRDGHSYRLEVETSVIKRGIGTQTGVYNPSSITPKLVEVTGSGEISSYDNQHLPSGFRIKIARNSDSLQPMSGITISIGDVAQNIPLEKVTIQLEYNNLPIDKETIHVVSDGAEGISATIYNIVPTSSNVIADDTSTSGTLKFKVYKKYGSNAIDYLSGSAFNDGEIGAVEVLLDGTSSVQCSESNSEFTCNINSSQKYATIQINLLVGTSRTKVCSIVVPVAVAGASGTQTLEKSVLREVTISNYSTPTQFYGGKDTPVGGVYYQDFVRYNNTNDMDNWGTYLCVTDGTVTPSNIPNSANFVKLDYTFAEVVSYLIADQAFIDALSVRQVVVLDSSQQPKVVAGMTSGTQLPTEVGANNSTGVRIWAGEFTNGDIKTAPFTVDSTGHVKAEDISINGTGSFNGNVSATSFDVVNPNTGDIQMQLSTWGVVSGSMGQEQLQKLDLNTVDNLTSDSPVIVLTDSDGNKYLLNLLAFNATPSDHITVYQWSDASHNFQPNISLYYNSSDDKWYKDKTYSSIVTSNDMYVQYVGSFTGVVTTGAQPPAELYKAQKLELYRLIDNNNVNPESATPTYVIAHLDLAGTSKYYRMDQNTSTIAFTYVGPQTTTTSQLLYGTEFSIGSGTSWNDIATVSNIAPLDVLVKSTQYDSYTVVTDLIITRSNKEWTLNHRSI